MSLYDTISTYQPCPYCGHYQSFECQTKELGRNMFDYHALNKDWETNLLDKKMRITLPIFKHFPLDKPSQWENQAEKSEALATVPEKYSKLNFIKIIADCHSIECQFDADRADILRQDCPSGFGRTFHGKIRIIDGKLFGPIYDIEKDELEEKELRKYKSAKKEIYNKLKKKYKHEPIICRNWHEGRYL